METLGVAIKEVSVRRGKWIAWMKSNHLVLKYNVDGSRRGHGTTSSGIVRDSNCDFVFGFSLKLFHDDILQAELESIFQTLQIRRERQFVNIEVESDSELVCHMILIGPGKNGNICT